MSETTTTVNVPKCLRCGEQLPFKPGVAGWVACPECGEEWIVRADTPLKVARLVERELEQTGAEVLELKASLLAKYAGRAPTRFRQADLFRSPGDCYSDAEGDGIFGGDTHELMRGADVRVLMKFDLPKSEAARMLRKLADSIETGLCERGEVSE